MIKKISNCCEKDFKLLQRENRVAVGEISSCYIIVIIQI